MSESEDIELLIKAFPRAVMEQYKLGATRPLSDEIERLHDAAALQQAYQQECEMEIEELKVALGWALDQCAGIGGVFVPGEGKEEWEAEYAAAEAVFSGEPLLKRTT